MHVMHAKLSSKETRIFQENGKTFNLAPLENLKELFLVTTQPKKYIVTLRPLKKKANADGQPETRKVLVNAEDVLKGKHMFDTKFTAKTPILEKIDESTENSTTSVAIGNTDLKVARTYLRLCAGGGTKKKDEEQESTTTNEKRDAKTETKEEGTATKEAHKEPSLTSAKVVEDKNEKKDKQKDAQKDTHSLPKAVAEAKNKNEEKKKSSKIRSGNKEKDQKQEKNKEEENAKEINKANILHSVLPEILKGDETKEKVIANDKESGEETKNGCSLPAKSKNIEVASVSKDKVIYKVNSNIKEEEQADAPASNEPTHVNNNELRTTQTVPTTAAKGKYIFPPCRVRETPTAQFDQTDNKMPTKKRLSELYCSLASDIEMCKRIQRLEGQVIQITTEMKDLQRELLPSDDVAKLNLITKRFDEVNNLLRDLKLNCMELNNFQKQMNEKEHIQKGNEDDEWQSTDLESDSNEEYPNEIYCYRRPVQNLYPSPRPAPAQSNANNLQSNRPHRNVRPNQYFTETSPFEQSRQQAERPNTTKYRSSLPVYHNNQNSLNFRYIEPNYRKRRLTDPQRVVDSNTLYPVSNAQQYNTAPHYTNQTPYQHPFDVPRQNFAASSSKKYSNNGTPKTRNTAGRDNIANHLSAIDNEINPEYYINDTSTQVVKSNAYQELPLVTHNLSEAIWNIIGNTSTDNIALTIFIERNNLYHINISIIQTGQCLGCVYTNEAAFEQAKKQNLFNAFFVFLVLNSDNSLEEKSKVLGFSFDFVNINN